MVEFENVFGDRKKRKYGLIGNIAYTMRASYEFDKTLFYSQILPVIPIVAASYLGTLIPSEVVRSLQEHWDIVKIVGYISLLLMAWTQYLPEYIIGISLEAYQMRL